LAIEKMTAALKNYHIHGIHTNLGYLLRLIQHPAFVENKISTAFCDNHTDEIVEDIRKAKAVLGYKIPALAYLTYVLNSHKIQTPKNVWEMLGCWRNVMKFRLDVEGQQMEICLKRQNGRQYVFQTGKDNDEIWLHAVEKNRIEFRIFQHFMKAVISDGKKGVHYVDMDGLSFEIKRFDELPEDTEDPVLTASEDKGSLFAPMPGKVIKINVKEGDSVKRGTVLLVVEAMKMENNIIALDNGVVEKINVKEGDRVDTDLQLVNLVTQETDSQSK